MWGVESRPCRNRGPEGRGPLWRRARLGSQRVLRAENERSTLQNSGSRLRATNRGCSTGSRKACPGGLLASQVLLYIPIPWASVIKYDTLPAVMIVLQSYSTLKV